MVNATGAAHARHENVEDDVDSVPVVDLYNLSRVQCANLFALRVVHPACDGSLGVLGRILYRELRSIVRVGLRGFMSMRLTRCTKETHVVRIIVVDYYDLEVGAGDVLLADNELGGVFFATQDICDPGLE